MDALECMTIVSRMLGPLGFVDLLNKLPAAFDKLTGEQKRNAWETMRHAAIRGETDAAKLIQLIEVDA